MKKRLAVIATMLMVAASMTACGSKADTTAKESIVDTESVEEVTEEPETEAVAEVTGTEEPERVTVVPSCFAEVIGIMPAQTGSVIPAWFFFSRKR